MSSAVEKLRAEVEALSVAERVELAEFLIRSLNDSPDDATWSAELQRRVAEIEDGTAVGTPAEQVFAQLRAKYA